MIRLSWLVVKNFQSFAKESVFTFPEKGLVLIRGEDTKTGESSGTGKSTINRAIAYALDFPNQLPATELQSWHTKDQMQVRLCLETDIGEVIIERGKKNSIKVGGQIITGARAISEKLREILGQTPEVMAALTYRPQGKDGLFLGKADAEKKEFLAQLLGLEKFEDSVAESAEKIKNLENLLIAHEQSYATWQSAVEERRAKLTSPVYENDASVHAEIASTETKMKVLVADLERSKQKANTPELKQLASRIGAEKGIIQALEGNRREATLQKMPGSELTALHANVLERIDNLRRDDEVKKQKMEVDKRNVQSQLDEVNKRIATRPFIAQKIEQKEAEIASIKASTCPTCKQTWTTADLSRYIEEVAVLWEQIHSIDAAGALVSLHATRLRNFVFIPDPNIEKLVTLERKLYTDLRTEEAKFLAKKSEALKSMADQIVESQKELAKLEGEWNVRIREIMDECSRKELLVRELSHRIRAMEVRVETIQKQNEWQKQAHERDRNELFQAENELKNIEIVVEQTKKLLNEEKDYVAMVGRTGFLGAIFDEILQEISEEANARLGRMANVSQVTIRFRTETIQQKGTTKKTIVPLVSVGGHEGRLEAALSGGMKDSVHQIVDLALMSVIQRRTGCIPGWFSMDEAGPGQGIATKEAALEILRAYAQDKLILVIDHSSEIKEIFSNFIDVIFENGFSRVRHEKEMLTV